MTAAAHSRNETVPARGDGHFAALDALRAVAALLVLVFHVGPRLNGGAFSHAYLAVDFFFMFSGFVLSHAYDARFADGMTTISFMRRRLRRLWPTMAVGILLGAAATWGRGAPLDFLLPVMMSELLFVPVGRGAVDLFVLNGVQWSLLLELFANLVHAASFRWTGPRTLMMTIAVAFIALFALASVHGGLWIGYNGNTMVGGIVRVVASYGTGMLIYRLWTRFRAMRARVGAQYAVAGLVAALLLPSLVPSTSWWIDPLVVIAIFPALLWLGASAHVPQEWRPAAAFGGGMSYPLYAFHLPILALGALFIDTAHQSRTPIITAAAAVVAVGISCWWAWQISGRRDRALSVRRWRRATQAS